MQEKKERMYACVVYATCLLALPTCEEKKNLPIKVHKIELINTKKNAKKKETER
jgi:hypothetical protein